MLWNGIAARIFPGHIGGGGGGGGIRDGALFREYFSGLPVN